MYVGPSRGVNRMRTKRNYNHASKNERVVVFLTYAHMSLMKYSLKNYYDNMFLPWAPRSFSTKAQLLPFPPQNPLDHASG